MSVLDKFHCNNQSFFGPNSYFVVINEIQETYKEEVEIEQNIFMEILIFFVSENRC